MHVLTLSSYQNDYAINPGAAYLSSYAFDIVNQCARNGGACGQEFDTDRYNIIVLASPDAH